MYKLYILVYIHNSFFYLTVHSNNSLNGREHSCCNHFMSTVCGQAILVDDSCPDNDNTGYCYHHHHHCHGILFMHQKKTRRVKMYQVFPRLDTVRFYSICIHDISSQFVCFQYHVMCMSIFTHMQLLLEVLQPFLRTCPSVKMCHTIFLASHTSHRLLAAWLREYQGCMMTFEGNKRSRQTLHSHKNVHWINPWFKAFV